MKAGWKTKRQRRHRINNKNTEHFQYFWGLREKMIKIKEIQKLREETGLPVMECKSALEEAKGDFQKAKKILKEKSSEKAAKKASRTTKNGIIESYSHNGKIGVLLELLCESDFVAKNQEFKNLAHDLVLQIASMDPKNEKELLSQPFIKDETKTISDLVSEKIARTGENIKINRFVRWEL
jgi:elongation factor Ts